MANSQPFNLPFPIPPLPFQQSAGAPQQQQAYQSPHGRPVDPRQAPMTEGFQYNGSLPGLNMQAFTPNSQPQQYQYWPPPPTAAQNSYGNLPFPPPFLAQNGLPFPPPPPGANLFPQIQPPTAPNPPIPSPANAQPSPLPVPPYHHFAMKQDRVSEVTSDKEEGELSETDAIGRPQAQNGRASAETPRSIPQLSHNLGDVVMSNNGQQMDPPAPAQHQQVNKHSPKSTNGQSDHRKSLPKSVLNFQQNEEESKRFLLALNQSNIGYSVLAGEEGIDAELLSNMYQKLHLPLHQDAKPDSPPAIVQVPQASKAVETTHATKHPAKQQPPVVNGHSTQAHSESSLPNKTTVITAVPATKAAPSPIDRKDYIARLQAAKAAKQAAKTTPPQSTPPAAAHVAIPPSKATAPGPSSAPLPVNSTITSKDPTAEEVRQRKNELLRQRLAMLTAQQRQVASRPSTPQTTASTVPSSSSISIHGLPKDGQSAGVITQSPKPSTSTKPTQPASEISSYPTLPGLFMNPPSAASQPNNEKAQVPAHFPAGPSGRKRPVASDFDEATTPRSGPVYTRPLGQSPHEHDSEAMIIEVSEDDGSEMDLEDDQAEAQSSSFLPPALQASGQPSLRNLPSLSDFPSRSESIRPASSAISTPPATRTPGNSLAFQEEALRKETEILNLKLKIAEMTRKRKEGLAKKDAISSSPALLPQRIESSSELNHVGSAQKPTTLIPSALPPQEPVATEVSVLAGVKTREWKRQRRAQIESGLQSLNAGLETGQARLAQLEKEMAKIRADEDRYQQDRQKLINELESLGIDTNGMPDEDLLAAKDVAVYQQENEVALPAEDALLSDRDTNAEPSLSIDQTNDRLLEPTRSADYHSQNITTVGSDTTLAPTSRSYTEQHGTASDSVTDHKDAIAVLPDPSNQSSAVDSIAPQIHSRSGSDIITVAPANNAVEAPETRDSATPMDDGDDFYSPEPTVALTGPCSTESSKPAPAFPPSPSEGGEVEMSESSSEEEEEEEEDGEDYEPEEPSNIAIQSQTQSVRPDQEIVSSPASPPTSSSASMSSSEDEGEVYEPPDVSELGAEGVAHPHDDAVSDHHSVEEVAMDISTSSPAATSPVEEHAHEPVHGLSGSSHAPQDGPLPVADDLASELQPQDGQQSSPMDLVPAAELESNSNQFVPYESPLRMFKSYRYHPTFPQEVTGGFLSMTYSHQIDPHKPLCRFESIGGTCNDPDCPDQHFRAMNITGEKLLVQLGTANPGKSPQERQQWNDGLRLVLKDLRHNNIKDPNGIAMEIAKYRRQFLEQARGEPMTMFN